MNQNPWFIEQMSKIERQQIQADMRQIRLAEKAMQADHPVLSQAPIREPSSPLLRRVTLTLSKAILAMIG